VLVLQGNAATKLKCSGNFYSHLSANDFWLRRWKNY